MVAGVGFEPHDLRVMSPTSYQAAPSRDILLMLTNNITFFKVCQPISCKNFKYIIFALEIFLPVCYNYVMNIDLQKFNLNEKCVAVAVSGGQDSMCLLHYLLVNSKKFNYSVVAINVEHGIRGESSVKDSEFVKDYCAKNGVPCYSFTVDVPAYAQKNKLTLEQAGRKLRYDIFYETINNGNCDVVATAHHLGDNVESILLNLFRGSGVSGVVGINEEYSKGIIRPMLNVQKSQIELYSIENGVPFVTDETNADTDYTRNFLRINIIPKIKEIFPEFEKSVLRFSSIIESENAFLEDLTKKSCKIKDGAVYLPLSLHPVLFNRATVYALKELGLKKDWEKAHVDGVAHLKNLKNGSKTVLPKGIVAIKEYDNVVLYRPTVLDGAPIPYSYGEWTIGDYEISVKEVLPSNLKDGLFADGDKIPKTAVIRYKNDGDVFTKFGGGTKKLNDYFTDKKIPLRRREFIPVLANENKILVIFGVAVSNAVRVDEKTKTVVEFSCKEKK